MSTAPSSSKPLEDFFQLTKTLMTAVKNVFPECTKTQEALAQLEFIETSNVESLKTMLIETWYQTMKPYIQECVQKNDNVLLRSNIKVLDQLDIKTKWADPEFDQESKQIMWEYINTLNYLACLYSESSPEDVQGLSTAASRLAEAAQFEITDDGKFSFNIQAFQALLSDKSKQSEIAALMPLAAPLMQNIMGGGSADGADGASGLQAFLQAQMGNFGNMFNKPK
jgi:hypothetical protein